MTKRQYLFDFASCTSNRLLPEHLYEGIDNYISYRIPPGNFVMRVLENDLIGAAAGADYINKPKLADIADWVYYNLPPGSYGSKENVCNWLNDKHGTHAAYKEKLEKAATFRLIKESD